jgi:hypothetical protein
MYSLFADLAEVEVGDPIHLLLFLLFAGIVIWEQPILIELDEQLFDPPRELAAVLPAHIGLMNP